MLTSCDCDNQPAGVPCTGIVGNVKVTEEDSRSELEWGSWGCCIGVSSWSIAAASCGISRKAFGASVDWVIGRTDYVVGEVKY